MATVKHSRRKTGRAGHHRHGFAKFSADIIKFELDTGLVDCLVSWLVLTTEDAEKISRTPGQTNRNKRLLNILKERPYNTFSRFTEALETTDPIYNDLVREMKTFEVEDGQPNDKFADESINIDDFSVRFQKSYKTLVDQITCPMKLVDILLELETFNREDFEDINSLTTVFQQNRKLLSKVARKGRSGYEKFLRALKTSDDSCDQDLAKEVESMEISQDDKLLLQIGITLSLENENIPSNVREIAQQLEDYWIEEDSVFVETKGTTKVFNTIKDSDVISIAGSSGSGKTAIMRHVVLQLKSKERFQVMPVDSPDKIMEYRDGNTKHIFLIDDVLGTYSVSPILVEKWERLDSQIQHCLNKNPGYMKLLFTVRKQLVCNQKFSNCSSIITQNIVDLEDDQIALSKEEKKQILIKHLRIKDMEGSITEDDLEEACASVYSFPLLYKIVSSDDKRLRNIAKFFREPFSVLEVELRKLWTENKQVYCSLVFCMLLNGKIGKDFFDVHLPKHENFNVVTEACGLDTNVSRKMIEDSLTSVVGTYVSRENGIFYFMHDAFIESISSNFAKLNPDVMFSCCDIDLIRDRVRINSRLPDDDDNVIVINKDQFEVIGKRILTECEEGRFSNVLLSQLIKNEEFVEYLGTTLNSKKQTTKNTLMGKVSVERRVNKRTICYFVKSLFFCVFASCMCKGCTSNMADNKRQNKIDVNNAALKHVIRAPPRQSTCIHWILASGCYSLFRYFWENASKEELKSLLSRDWKCPLTKPFFPLAVLGGNIDIIRTLLSSGADVNCFSDEGETPLSITAKSGRGDIAAVLIDWGADVNQSDMSSHRLPSFICVENDNVEVLKILLINNCDVNLVDLYGRSFTMLQALLTRKRDIVNVLLEFDSRDHLLHAAILNGDVDCLRTNLENEDINSQTRNGLTTLHYATQVNGTAMIRSLLGDHAHEEPSEQLRRVGGSQERPLIPSMVANINSKNKNGLTPLHLAVLNDHVEAVKFLVERNADVNVKDQFGRIPLHYSQSPVISSLLLDRGMSKSLVAYSAKSCSVVPVHQSDVVVVDIDGDQEDHRRTLPWCTVFRNVAWFFLPFKRCIYRGNVNQPDNQGNTPLHVVVETSRDLHPEMKGNYDSAGNIKILMKHGANIHLRNDEGHLCSDLVKKSNDQFTVFASSTSRLARDRDSVILAVLLLISLILCYALVISPLTLAMTNILKEYNNLNDSFVSNQTNLAVLKRLEQRVDDLLMYYFLLIGIVFFIMTNVMIIRVVIQLLKTNCRNGIACLLLLFMMQCSAVTLFVLYERTFTFIRVMYVIIIFILMFNSCHFGFAIIIKEILLLKIKSLQKIIIFLFFANVIFVVATLLTFLQAPLNKETMSTLNKTFEICSGDIVQNGSFINQEPGFIDTTSFQPSTIINCTKNFSVPEEDFTSVYSTFVFMVFISIGLWIFKFLCEKHWIKLQNTKIATKSILKYNKNIWQMHLFNSLMVLFIMFIYSSKMNRLTNAIYYP